MNRQTGPNALGLFQWLSRRSARGPGRPALSCDDVTWSYAGLVERVEKLSAVLAAGGVGADDRVAYLGFNHPMFLVTLFACSRLGAIFVPLNFRLTGPELEFIINDAGVHTLIAGEEHVAPIEPVRESLCVQRYLRLETAGPGWEAAGPLAERVTTLPPEVESRAEDVAVIMYTSGTTGHPKGAMLTHGNFWCNNVNTILMMDMASTDTALNFAPLFHVGGLCVVSLQMLLAGGHLVLQRQFDAGEALRAIERYRVTVGFAVPAMLLFMSQHPDFGRTDLSSLRLIAVGGAPVPEPLLRLYQDRRIPVHQGYGMTETTTTITFLSPERSLDKLGSCGTPPVMTQMRLADFSGKPVTAANVKGEVLVRGGNVMKGYWNRPDANAAAFDAEGWFRTGDVGYVDDEGFLFLCDRVKDMVISGGENVYPAEVESVLYEHPAISEVAVIGAPDERWGERVVAVAVVKPGASLSLEALQLFAGARLARYKLPRELRLVDVLPRNPGGKVLKTRLREMSK